MREIKFRGTCVNTKIKVTGNILLPEINANGEYESAYISIPFADSVSVETIQVDPKSIYQYTGLKDTNGDMIFENDTIEFQDRLYRVIYRDGTYFGISSMNTHWIQYLYDIYKYCKIVKPK